MLRRGWCDSDDFVFFKADIESAVFRTSMLFCAAFSIGLFLEMLQGHWLFPKIRTFNCIESLNREIKRCTQKIGIFPNIESCERFIGTILRKKMKIE